MLAGLARLSRTSLRDLALLVVVAAAAFFVHGYHPAAEDAAIYVPGIKKLLRPALYPFNDEFFAAHASRTLFPRLIAETRFIQKKIRVAMVAWAFADGYGTRIMAEEGFGRGAD